MDTLKKEIFAAFRGGFDVHGFNTVDIDAVHAYAVEHGITDADQARREYCASLEDDHKCQHNA